MKRLIASASSLLLFLASAITGSPPSWWTIDESMGFAGAGGRPIRAAVITIDPAVTTLRVVSAPFEAKGTVAPSEVSLRALAGALATANPRYRSREWIAINGAFSSFRVDVPLGLLVVDGKVYSTLSKEKSKTDFSPKASEFGQLRWAGVLCQLKDKKQWEIVSASRYQPDMCLQALQSGPVLVAPDGIVAIAANEPSKQAAYTRTAVCLTAAGRMRFVLVSEATHLYPLAQWLAREPPAGGLGCRSALNLSGDSSSGIAVRSPRDAPVRYFGEGSFPIPSALIVEGK